MNIPDIVTTSAKHMTRQERRAGIRQMIHDLEVLARDEGHMAAAWALEVVEAVRDRYVLRPEYAYETIEEYEKIIGVKVNDAFRIGWDMARTTNALLDLMANASVSITGDEPDLCDEGNGENWLWGIKQQTPA